MKSNILLLLCVITSLGCSSNKNYTKPQFYSSLSEESYEQTVGTTPKEVEYTQAPIIERKFPPEIPLEAIEQNMKGMVTLDVEILSNGQTGAVEVIESSGHKVLDYAAVKAAKTWRFSPALNDKMPVAVWASFPIEFK
jgi:TonB family protein